MKQYSDTTVTILLNCNMTIKKSPQEETEALTQIIISQLSSTDNVLGCDGCFFFCSFFLTHTHAQLIYTNTDSNTHTVLKVASLKCKAKFNYHSNIVNAPPVFLIFS